MASTGPPGLLHIPNAGIILRPEQVSDAAFLRQLFDQSRPLAGQIAHLAAAMREMLLHSQFCAQRQGYATQFPAARGYVLENSSGPIGRVLLNDGEDALHIIDLAILPPWRGQGLGTALLQNLAAMAAPHGLRLSVAEENIHAQRLYARLGFALTGQSPGYLHLARAARAS